MKKSYRAVSLAFSLIVIVSVLLAACAPATQTPAPSAPGATSAPAAPSGALKAGVIIYKFDDTFMTAVRNAITDQSKAVGVEVTISDAQNSQATENDQVDVFVSKKVNALAVNPVDLTAAGAVLDKAKAANIPVVFFNRQPSDADMAKWDKVYYVGAIAEQSGRMEGKILADWWKKHPEADKNKDGVLQYVMLTGEPGHQDAILRTKFSVQQLNEDGVKTEELAQDTAMWDRPKAQDKMAAFISKFGDKLEAVITNNDDMALGAIGALKAAGYFTGGKYMPVVGVDATSAGVAALKDGTLLGTVLNDAVNQGKAVMNLTAVLAAGKTPDDKNVGYKLTGKYVWVDYKPITLDNIADAGQGPAPAAGTKVKAGLNAGVIIYKFDDTFMTAVRNAITDQAKSLQVNINISDAQNSQATENDQVDVFVSKKVNALAVNPVDLTAAGAVLDKAKAANIPVVFFNRQPSDADMAKWDKVYYVGAIAEQSGRMEGKILADWWKKHPEADKNKDGVLQYVMLTGEPGHQDAILRTKFSVQQLNENGVKTEELAQDTAMWDRPKAQDKMAAFISKFGDKIEAVITNNDDMALGAIGALKAAGYFTGGKYMPVVGVDATSAGVAALKDGTLLGTVLNDAVNQGKAVMNLTAVLADGQVPTDANVGYKLTGKYIWVDYKPITLDNIADAGQK